MRGLPSGPYHLHRKDVPHLSESILIGVERWRFVEGVFKKFLNFMNRRLCLESAGVSALEVIRAGTARAGGLAGSALDGQPNGRGPDAATDARGSTRTRHDHPSPSARRTMSPTSGDSEGVAATRRRAACASAPRLGSSTRQVLNAESSRAASCGFLGSSANTMSTTKS